MTSKNSQKLSLGIKPLAGFLLVEPEQAGTTTPSGIVLPETAKEKPAQGKVVAVGSPIIDMGREVSSPVSVGDRVIYKKWGGDEIRVKGAEYKLVKFDDLMAILED
ncbi:MAG: 10 kDa chaperonin [Candidatus Daviesbacteria bacterium GW2011_GWA2_38_24]|uniref:Co-chaperonin GroES n=1 Tax=Candidatus Daviesbacteria bacterium GW2011_GWA2_38_24 TaxID=1618422 RepID=A0A0G0JJH9_9BACT|nr:MAG: 10 kDa chaperonin [Candidatus Daviesbacteria bacterium GW2011_GWA2_38_24]KKQ80762.1 MAG: 10 kDa chaperonin [Candidatus Daviesbacteria bacterium GW2011_GWA1_38_7]OGE22747.1 MAG: hypothetical protein A2688_01390 [Candidatus Daviesbacteria bacterium RIFCSPHIGHO2_01_FULL_38_8]